MSTTLSWLKSPGRTAGPVCENDCVNEARLSASVVDKPWINTFEVTDNSACGAKSKVSRDFVELDFVSSKTSVDPRSPPK